MILWLVSTTEYSPVLGNKILLLKFIGTVITTAFVLSLVLLPEETTLYLPSMGFMKPSWMRVAIAPAPPGGTRKRRGGEEGEKKGRKGEMVGGEEEGYEGG